MIDLNGWLRQARHRAKKHGVLSDLTTEDVKAIFIVYDGRCAYCLNHADSLDNPIPLSEHAPNVPANIVPCCKDCKNRKRNRNLAWMFEEGHIGSDRYVTLVQLMLAQRGAALIRPILRRAVGIVQDSA